MSRADAIYERNGLFINAAMLAVHANTENGFYQKDVKFYIELLTNWMETSFEGFGLNIQNTQVQRILEMFVNEGLLKKNSKKKRPLYIFTPIGLLEMTTRLVEDRSLFHLQNFYFLYHIVSLYSQKMEELLLKQKGSLPKSYQLEIKHLLNPQNLVERQKMRVQKEIDKLEDRVEEAHKMGEVAKRMKREGKSLDQIINSVEDLYPYQLNNQKKMGELFKSLPPDVLYLELIEAPQYRATTLWEPLLLDYKQYLQRISNLQ
ncbi:hypothetical protein N9N67_08030 [Bacteriovoracaceae bacterium]|nr:hypothetical protein [Bacteriovoracaceae bacterium]